MYVYMCHNVSSIHMNAYPDIRYNRYEITFNLQTAEVSHQHT